MPIYEYRCLQCDGRYEILHKVRELAADVVCPECGSPRATKLMSVAAVASHASAPSPSADRCSGEYGGCCGGSCGME
jgi:putative FmdB family regulatory protein